MLDDVQRVGFDIDGTMYQRTSEIDLRIQRKIAEKLLLKKPGLKDVNGALEFFKKEYATGKKGGGSVLRDVGYEDSGKVMDECIATANVVDLIKPDPKLVALVEELSQKYGLFVVTSNPRDVALRKLERLGLESKIFDFLVCSEDGEKRDGTAFKYALKLSGVEPPNHVFVGDSYDADIRSAKLVGMRAVMVDPKLETNSQQCLKTIYDLRNLLK